MVNVKLHRKRAREAWPLLVERARSSSPTPFTYGELCAKMTNTHHRAAAWFLGEIQTYCDQNGLAHLQALAVSKKTGLPGGGYWGSPRTTKDHKEELKKVIALAKKGKYKTPKF